MAYSYKWQLGFHAMDLAFNVKVYGATGDGVTDDTVAIQATITACAAAGGGTVFFPAGVYIVGGALQDTAAFNGQLLLPNVAQSGVDHMVITFRGELRPGLHPVYGDTVPLAAGLSVIKSTLTGGTGTASVISGGNNLAAPSSGGGNNLEVNVEDLVSLAPDNPTFTFWNLSATQGGAIRALQISTPGGFAGSAVQPTNTNAYGIKLPQKYFSNYTETTGLSIGGFYTCLLNGERADHRGLILGICIVGLEQPAMFFASVIHSMQLTSFQYGIRASGGDSRLDVLDYSAEHTASPAWQVTVYDLDDASNRIYGYIRHQNAVTGGTLDNTFTKNAGTNVLAEVKGPTWGGGAPTSADYLVGTANGSLSGEIVVGTTPGGELGGTWASPTVDATHSGSTHAATQAAAEATAAAALAAHAATDQHLHVVDEQFNGDAVTTVFPLAAEAAPDSVMAWVSGTRTPVTLGGTLNDQITFAVAPASGTNNVSVDYAAVLT